MVYLSWAGKSEKELLGCFLFHRSRGGIPLIDHSPYGHRNIGFYLGEVVEVNGPNRIFYLDAEGTQKYVSLKGVGLVCTSAKEVAEINDIRVNAHKAFKSALMGIAGELKSSLNNLL